MVKLKELKQESGFSLLELLLVVGVGALLLLAGIATYRLVTQGTSANEAVRILTTIKEKTQRAFQGQRGYVDGDDGITSVLVTMNAFPAGVLDDNDVPRHPYGGDITVRANATDAQRFDIIYQDVPSDACVTLGTSFDEEDNDFYSLEVNGTTFDDDNTITAASMAGACGTSSVDMTWTFY